MDSQYLLEFVFTSPSNAHMEQRSYLLILLIAMQAALVAGRTVAPCPGRSQRVVAARRAQRTRQQHLVHGAQETIDLIAEETGQRPLLPSRRRRAHLLTDHQSD